MTKEFKVDINIDAVTMDLGYITVTDGKVDTSNVEELFFAVLRKNTPHWLKESEEEERDAIFSSLDGSTSEDKLKEAHMKDYHGDKEHYEDSYEMWLENLTLDELKEYTK